MATEILISSDPWENRVAVLEGGSLAEIYVEREEKVIGSIYKGKVQNVLPGMGASFIDIGLGRNAFLYVDDINRTPLNIGDVEITQGRSGFTITEKVNRGDDVLVQIVKEPRGLKGARVSTNIQLPGRYLILMPTGKYSGVSRKIASVEDRNRLKTVMKAIRPEGMATVVRTAAGGVSQAELIADLGVLIRMWHGILETYKRAAAPALIHKDMNLVYKAARDFINPDVERVLIDDAEEYEKVRDFMRLLGPQYVDRIEHYSGGSSLFKDHKIDEELEKLMRPTIDLPSGGSIVIESTEALTVIDVNSGKFTGGKNLEDTIVRTNVEAAAEIARQVRLRDIGGIIVCDFIDMGSESSRNRVIETLETGLRRDRSRTTIQSFSALGLLEFTRKRIGKDLAGQLRGRCPTCVGLGSVLSPETVAIKTFREVRRLGRDVTHANGKAGDAHAANPTIHIHAAPTVGAQLDFWYEDEMHNLESEIGAKVDVVVDGALHPEKTTIAVGSQNGTPSAGVRVGDEVEVDLLHAKLPNPTSALAVVGNKLVEVENAAGAIGHSIRIKIIDIDDEGNILAEPRAPVVQAAAGEGRKRRRRGGRGRRKPLTAAEQTEQLRELAEEAARGLSARVAIGISTSADAEAEAATEPHPTAAPIAVAGTDTPAPPYFADAAANGTETGDGKRRRRRRRRRRGAGLGAGEALAGIPATSAVVQTIESDSESDKPLVAAATMVPAGATVTAPGERLDENGVRKRRRRRRRRGRGTGAGVGVETAAAAAPTPTAVPDRHVFRVAGSGAAEPTGRVAPPEPNRAIARRATARSAAVAVEAPPKSISAPVEDPKVTRPSRRRPTAAAAKEPASIASTRQRALPAAPEEPAKRTTRAKATSAKPTAPKAAAKTPAVKKTTAKAAAAKKAPAKATTRLASPKVAAKAAAVKKTATKKASATKVAVAKAPAAKAPAAKKTPARKVATAAKKTTRKKS